MSGCRLDHFAAFAVSTSMLRPIFEIEELISPGVGRNFIMSHIPSDVFRMDFRRERPKHLDVQFGNLTVGPST